MSQHTSCESEECPLRAGTGCGHAGEARGAQPPDLSSSCWDCTTGVKTLWFLRVSPTASHLQEGEGLVPFI